VRADRELLHCPLCSGDFLEEVEDGAGFADEDDDDDHLDGSFGNAVYSGDEDDEGPVGAFEFNGAGFGGRGGGPQFEYGAGLQGMLEGLFAAAGYAIRQAPQTWQQQPPGTNAGVGGGAAAANAGPAAGSSTAETASAGLDNSDGAALPDPSIPGGPPQPRDGVLQFSINLGPDGLTTSTVPGAAGAPASSAAPPTGADAPGADPTQRRFNEVVGL
jgi:hypothetical protein